MVAGAGRGSPHGGRLVDQRLAGEEAAVLAAGGLPSLVVTAAEAADLRALATGAYSPLTGFMDAKQHQAVCEWMRLPEGLLWPIPVCLGLPEDVRVDSEQVLLRDQAGGLLGVLQVQAVVAPLAGPVGARAFTPTQTRAAFQARGWATVVGFQTRNPVHRAHEYLMKCALETVDGLLLHPLVGPTKDGDVPAEVRMAAYQAVLDYFPAGRVLLGALVAPMRYAGPREAVLHALVRKNYGCTHFIVGRDHAGVGSYYGTFQAQQLIASL